MPRELPEARRDLEKLTEALDRWDRDRLRGWQALARLHRAWLDGHPEWRLWKQRQPNAAVLNRFVGALSVLLLNPPIELKGFADDSGKVEHAAGRAEALGIVQSVQAGDFDAADQALASRPTFVKLRGAVLYQIRKVDLGELGAALAALNRATSELVALPAKVREAAAFARQTTQPPDPRQPAGAGRRRVNISRDEAVYFIALTDQSATLQSIAEALVEDYPEITPGIVDSTLKAWRGNGFEVRLHGEPPR